MDEVYQRLSRTALVASLAWAAATLVALVVTLASLREDDFDGLNNMLQVPFALPWWLVVPALPSHFADALVTAGLGLLNGVLLFVLVSRWDRKRQQGA